MAGGDFLAPYTRLARWSGTRWGEPDSPNSTVESLCYHAGSGKLYISGAFTAIGGVAVNRVGSTVNGDTFVDEGFPYAYEPQVLVSQDSSHIIAAFIGAYIDPTDKRPHRYDGATWTQYAAPGWRYNLAFGCYCSGIDIFNAQPVAWGYDVTYPGTGILLWDGATKWDAIDPYVGHVNIGYSATEFNGSLYACWNDNYAYGVCTRKWLNIPGKQGYYTDWSADSLGTQSISKMLSFDGKLIGKSSAPYLLYSDGASAWATYAGGTNGAITDMAVINNKLYIVGMFTTVGADALPAVGAAIYDGTTWQAMDTGLGSTPLAIDGFVSA